MNPCSKNPAAGPRPGLRLRLSGCGEQVRPGGRSTPDRARPPEGGPRRGRDLAALALVVALLVPIGLLNRGLAADDAYITYRYAQNLLRGGGFVYNPGERHLGTTSPLLALLLSAVGRAYPDLPFWGSALSILSLGAAAFFSYLILSRAGAAAAGFLALPLIVLNPVLIESLGNETCLLLALVAGQYYFYQSGRRKTFAVLAALGALARGEGIILPLLLFWFDFLRQARERRWDLRPLLVFAALLLPWLLFSRLYFGSFLPSTLSVKMAMARLPHSPWTPFFRDVMENLPGRFGPQGAGFAVLYLLFLAGAAGALADRRFVPFLLFFLAYYLGYGLLRVGSFPWYHAPVAFALSFFAAFGVQVLSAGEARLRERRDRLPSLLGTWLLQPPPDFRSESAFSALPRWPIFVPLGLILVASLLQRGIAFSNPRIAPYREAGIWLRENAPAEATVGIPEVGIVGFYAERRMFDIDGLVFPAMADPARLHSYQCLIRNYRPDYIISQGKSPYHLVRAGEVHPGVENLPFRYLAAKQVRSPGLQVTIWKREP